MTPGVSISSLAAAATFASVVSQGAWDANYPVTNLSDLRLISNIGRVTPATGRVDFTVVFPATSPVDFVGLVRHNIPAGATITIHYFSDNNPDPVGNLANRTAITVNSVWPGGSVPVSGYPSTTPVLNTSTLNARSLYVSIQSAGAGPLDIGGVEISKFWTWAGLAPGKEGGFLSNPRRTSLIGGADIIEDAWMPRKLNGEISFLALATAATTGIDFQRDTGFGKPFVYVQDYDDPLSWARQCWLARNVEVPPSVGRLYRHDAFQFRFREHWR